MIIVMGPPRTGTSLVMGLLKNLGLYVGELEDMRVGPAAHHEYYEHTKIQNAYMKGLCTPEEAIEGLEAYKMPLPLGKKVDALYLVTPDPKIIVTHRDIESSYRSNLAAVNKRRTMDGVLKEAKAIYDWIDQTKCPRLDVRFEHWFDSPSHLEYLAEFVGKSVTEKAKQFVDPRKRKF